MHISTLAAASFVAFALTAAVAQPIVVAVAPPPDTTPVVRHVSYADLNLASTAGQQTLNNRINGAVTAVCSDAGRFDRRGCETSARSDAQRQMDAAVAIARGVLLASRH